MNIIKKDLKVNLKSIIIWTIASSLMSFISVVVYDSTVATAAAQWADMVKTLPKTLLDAFNITDKAFESILGFYAVKGYTYVALLIAIFASTLGIKLINKEESDKTTEFILSKPISRKKYITDKIITLIIAITIVNLFVTILLALGIIIGSKATFDVNGFMSYSVAMYLITITFGLLSFMVATILKRVKNLSGIAIGIVLLSFFITIIANMSSTFTNIKYISLFNYIEPYRLLEHGLEIIPLLIFILLSIIATVISYISYMRKDIYS